MKNTRQLQGWLLDILHYADCVKKLTEEIVVKAIKTVFNKKEGEAMAATLFEELETRGETRGETRAITKFLETRFGEVPQDICDRIAACTDLKKLDTLTRLAASCQSIDEFKKGLK